MSLDIHGLEEFLECYLGMSIVPYYGPDICLRGQFDFSASLPENETIQDTYELEITVFRKFPRTIPSIQEIGGKIPRNGDYHVNGDGTLCLGSPIRLLYMLNKNPTILGFVDGCLIPYLYAVSYKKRHGGDFILGELAHGDSGIIDDYLDLFRLKDRSSIIQAVKLLGMKKRIANKQLCPCGCGKRLGTCSFRFKLIEFRNMAPNKWFRTYAEIK